MLYTLRQIKQRYNQRLVLNIDHLSIEEGRIHALLGANGAGKTTLLNILGFLEMPASGTLLFREQPVEPGRKSLQQLRRQVVLVDQQPIMFSTRVCDNIDFGLKIRKIEKKTRLRIIDEMLETVGLSRYRSTSARELSGGETQRLALARALALQPDVLLCDEPTANVDAENQAIIIDLLRRINRVHGTTIIFATHNRLQAASLAQHTLTLERGHLSATSGENSYQCTFTTEENGQLRCSIYGQIDLLLPASSAGQVTINTGRIILAPEKMTLHRSPCSTDANNSKSAFTGNILMVIAEEEKIRILINIGIMVEVLLDHTHYRRLNPAIGETLTLCCPADACTVQAIR